MLTCVGDREHEGDATVPALGYAAGKAARVCAGLTSHLQHRAGPCFSQAVRHKPCLYQPAPFLHPKGSFLHSRCIPLGTSIIYNSKVIATNGEERARQAWSEARRHKSHLQFCIRVQSRLRLLLDLAESSQEVTNLEGCSWRDSKVKSCFHWRQISINRKGLNTSWCASRKFCRPGDPNSVWPMRRRRTGFQANIRVLAWIEMQQLLYFGLNSAVSHADNLYKSNKITK